MNLLGAKLYDPASAVTKATSALLAMTALDTTNLRVAFTIPAHGMVRVRMMGVIHGATTFPSILLGVMDGANIRGRVAPVQSLGNTAVATALVNIEADFVIAGLTPGAVNWDAAYGVETVVASSAIKYGGPHNTTGNDAFGAFAFEVWDPQSVPTAAPGAANGLQIAGANAATTYASLTSTGAFSINGVSNVSQTGDNYARLGAPVGASHSADVAAVKAVLPAALVSGRIDASVGAIAANAITATAINADAITAAKVASDVTTEVQSGLATGANLATVAGYLDTEVAAIKTVTDKLDTALELDGAVYRYTTNALEQSPTGAGGGLDAAGTRAALGLASANLDTQLAGIQSDTDNIQTRIPAALVSGRMDSSVGAMATDVITASSIAADAIGSSELAASAVTEIQSGLSTLTAANIRSAVGLASANLDTQLDALPTNAELATALGTADDAVLTAIAALNNLSQANIRTAIGLATANLDTQLADLPTNSELATALASADDATLAAVAALNNLSSAQVQTAATAALNAYDPPTRAEATTDKEDVIVQINANETKIDGIKAKTDSLTFSVPGNVDANITHVNDTAVTGTGTEGDEWGS